MKNVWKSHKKIIMGAMAVVLVLGIVVGQVITSQTEAEAANILNSMKTKYGSRTEFNILEIVPEHNDANYEELGMFAANTKNVGNGNPGQGYPDVEYASQSYYFAQQFYPGLEGNSRLDRMLEMRMYGLLKRAGTDNGVNDVVSNNPIYPLYNNAVTPSFTEGNAGAEGYAAVEYKYLFTRGFYNYEENTNYKLADGYYIGDDGYIYKTPDATTTGNGTTPSSDEPSEEPQEDEPTEEPTEEPADQPGEEDETEDDSVSENAFTPTVAEGTVEEVTLTEELPGDDSEGDDAEEEQNNTETPEFPEGNTDVYTNNFQGYETLTVSENSVRVESDLSAKYYKTGADGATAYCPLPTGVIYVGDGTGNISFTANNAGYYWGYSTTPTYYGTNNNFRFQNGKWLKALLFGDKDAAIQINIETVAAGAVTEDQIEKADLVYISGTEDAFLANNADLTQAVAVQLFNATVLKNKAILMDYDAYSKNPNSNINKLAALLCQADQTAIAAAGTTGFNSDDTSDEFGSITNGGSVFSNSGMFTGLTETMLEGVQGNFVTGNVYVYDHHMDLFDNSLSMVDANDFFANGDLNSLYKSSVYNVAFSNVYAYVANNNANYANSRVIDGVTPALALQYILSSDGSGSNLVKATIRVLEIQPCADFLFNATNVESTEYGYAADKYKTNRDDFISAYINPDFVTDKKQGYVSFTSMTINEFVCKNESVAENYDMVYIGSQTGFSLNRYYYRTGCNYTLDPVTGRRGDAINISDFNDSNMTGMLYYNIGDTNVGTSRVNRNGVDMLLQAGFLAGESTDKSNRNTERIYLRYAGRDLTSDKLAELESYLDAGHPIIVATDLMCTNANGVKVVNPTAYTKDDVPAGRVVDHGRIDNSSKMYELFQYALMKRFDQKTGSYVDRTADAIESADQLSVYKNFISESDVERGLVRLSDINECLNAPQIYIDISDKPTEYEYTLNGNVIDPNSIKYLGPDEEDGAYYLDYEFTISGVSASDQSQTYTTRLLVDVNADGKFSSDEECDDAVVTYAATGEEAGTTVNPQGETVYELEEGIAYRLRRALPENYSGAITWCLRAEIVSDSRFQANETGYTCVKAEKKAVIKILQVTNDNRTNIFSWAYSTLNLEEQMRDNTSQFGKYLSALADYEVHVKTLTVTQFQNAYIAYANANPNATYMKFFDEYQVYTNNTNPDEGKGVNMMILGFGDDYAPFTQEQPIKAVKAFMDSGRAVLLCHDFMMFHSDDLQVKYLRDIVGMDRYGVTGDIASLRSKTGDQKYTRATEEEEVLAAENNPAGKLVAYQPGSGRNILLRATQGYSDTELVWNRYTGVRQNYYVNATAVTNYGTGNSQVACHIDQMNKGQLTEYPYNIPSSFRVATTHSQYYQLDLESDSDEDGSSDTVVWYTLSYLNDRTGVGNNELYNATPGDGANQYYIYNKGNITYTGAGHNRNYTESEVQLFVNTMLASYSAVDRAPTVQFFETSSAASNILTNVAIPYDSTVTQLPDPLSGLVDAAQVDSSMQYNDVKGDFDYKFVNPNVDTSIPTEDRTAVYFKVTDANFKKGTKRISLQFYLKVNAVPGSNYTLDNNTTVQVEEKTINDENVSVVKIPIQVYSSDFSNTLVSEEIVNEQGVSTQNTEVQSGTMYGMYLPLSYLKNNGAISLYVEAQTYVNNVATSGASTSEVNESKGYGKVDVTKVDLLKLD